MHARQTRQLEKMICSPCIAPCIESRILISLAREELDELLAPLYVPSSSSKFLGNAIVIIFIKDGTPLVELHSKAPFVEGTRLRVVGAQFGVIGHGDTKTDRLTLLRLREGFVQLFCRTILRFNFVEVPQVGFFAHLGWERGLGVLLWVWIIERGCRRCRARLRVDFVLLVGYVDVVLRHCCHADATVECILECMRRRSHFQDVTSSRSSRLWRVQGQNLCVHDVGYPSVWRSP